MIGPKGSPVIFKKVVITAGFWLLRLPLSARPKNGSGNILVPTLPSQMQSGGPQMYGGTGGWRQWKRVLGHLPRGSKEMLILASWMMGYPATWLKASFAAWGMQSSRKSQRP